MGKKLDIAIIGGGASGMMAAITAASFGAKVTLYEQKKRVGQKILSTGNGKCNFSNRTMSVSEYYTPCPERVQAVLERFSVDETVDFFAGLGVMARSKNGYLYPYSEQSQTIHDALRLRLAECGVEVLCNQEIKAVNQGKGGGFSVADKTFDRLIIACGSLAGQRNGMGESGYRLAEKLGHKSTRLVPGLCHLPCRDEHLIGLAGVRCQATVSLYVEGAAEPVQTETGELQFTQNALSGIPVFQLSRTAGYLLAKKKEVALEVNFFPNAAPEKFEKKMRGRLARFSERTLGDFLLGMTNKKINQSIIRKNGLHNDDKVADIDKEKMWALLMEYQGLRFQVAKAESLVNAQVCAGGVALSGLSDDLESLAVPGLYFAGEILDVDGRCGGYNLQWAWSSGHVAGKSAAQG